MHLTNKNLQNLSDIYEKTDKKSVCIAVPSTKAERNYRPLKDLASYLSKQRIAGQADIHFGSQRVRIYCFPVCDFSLHLLLQCNSTLSEEEKNESLILMTLVHSN